jgi:hypothetical protein
MPLPHAQYLPYQRSWLATLSATILTLLIGGCGLPSPAPRANTVTPPAVNLNDAPIVGALYQGQIPGLGLAQWDLRNQSDAGDSGTPHAIDSLTVSIEGNVRVERDRGFFFENVGLIDDLRNAGNTTLPRSFEVKVGSVNFSSQDMETAEYTGKTALASYAQNPQPVLMSRVAVFRLWKGRFRPYDADFPVFEDDMPFHREVTARLAADARDFAADGDDEEEADIPGFGDQTVDILVCRDNLVCVGISSTAAGGSSSHWYTDRNFVNDAGHARELSLAELFSPGSRWEKKLSDFCITDLFRQYGPYNPNLPEGQEPEDESAPFGVLDGTVKSFTPKQLSNFSITPAGLVINLSSSDVGGGKNSDCGVTIPWSELRGYLRPDGPARFLTGLSPTIASK